MMARDSVDGSGGSVEQDAAPIFPAVAELSQLSMRLAALRPVSPSSIVIVFAVLGQ